MTRTIPRSLVLAAPLAAALLAGCTRPPATDQAAAPEVPATPPSSAAHALAPADASTDEAATEPLASEATTPENAAPRLSVTASSPLGPSRGHGRTFATELFAQSLRRSGNQAVSAPNVHAALSMLALGARGNTAQLMVRTLALPAARDAQIAELKRLTAHWPAQAGEATLHSAARLWLAQQATPQPDYLRAVDDALHASAERVDFAADAERARARINQWVEQETRGLIPELMPRGSVTSSTQATATTTLYFKGLWQNPFASYLTRTQSFTLENGTEISVPTMHTTQPFAAHAGRDFVAVTLPYRDSSLRMTLLRAADGQALESAERRYVSGGLAPLLARMSSRKIQLALPKFAIGTGGPIGDALAAMGFGPAFAPSADFSGALANGALRLQEVIHKVVVIVDEEGTEAAAATGAVLGSGGAPEQPLAIAFDRPFLFFLHDAAGEVLLAGRLLDPR